MLPVHPRTEKGVPPCAGLGRSSAPSGRPLGMASLSLDIGFQREH